MTATPGRVGEVIRLRWLKRETGLGYTRLLPAAFADRAIQLAAIVLVIGAALAAAGLGSVAAWWVVVVAALLVGIAFRHASSRGWVSYGGSREGERRGSSRSSGT